MYESHIHPFILVLLFFLEARKVNFYVVIEPSKKTKNKKKRMQQCMRENECTAQNDPK